MPELPPHFLPRPEELEALKKQVLRDGNQNRNQRVVLTGTSRRVGVQGMGGIGKSVLAAALGRDEEVQRNFPDGVVWIPVGQTPQMTTWQAYVAEKLGDTKVGFTDENLGKAHLRELLAQKACLLILDDIWDVKHAAAFDVLGEKCQMLITSRDAGLITSLGAKEYKLGVLNDEQALALLAQWADQPRETLPQTARQVVRECGNLPLAVAMIGAMVRGKPNRWENVLQKLRNADLEKIRQQFPDYPYPDLLKAIQVSVEALEPDFRERYLDFAVFPEDTPIPETVLQTFWEPQGLDEYDTQDVVDELVKKSLALRDEKGNLSLHDLQFDYVRKQAKDLSELHNRLLSAYAEKCPDGWHSGENDGYFFGQLGYHLLAAKRAEEFRQLLFDFRWLQAKLDRTSVTELIADYELVFPTSASNVSPSKESGEEEKALKLVQGAIRLSAHILEKDKTQLAGQLLGRLLYFDVPEIREMLEVAKQWQAALWLHPLTASLTAPGGALLRTLTGHSNRVTGVAIAPSGNFAVSVSNDHTLKVWDLYSGHLLKTLAGHTESVTAVAIAPDGNFAVSASKDHTLKVWDLYSGHLLKTKTLTGHTKSVTAVAIAPSGNFAVSASNDHTLKVWDLSSGEERKTLTGHTDWITAVAIAPSGNFAVSASNDHTLKVWDLSSGEERKTLTGHTDWITAVAIAPSGNFAVSASDDQTLKVWHLDSGHPLKTLTGHTNRVTAVAIAPSGKFAVSASDDQTLKVWHLDSGHLLKTLTGHTDWVTAVAIAPSGKFAVSASDDQTLKVWHLDSGHLLKTLTGHTKEVRAVAIAPDGKFAVSASWDKTLKVWDLESGKEVKTLGRHTSRVVAVAIAPNSNFAVSASLDDTLKVWDLDSGQERKTLVGHTSWVRAVAIAPNSKFAVSASDDRALKVWDLASGKEIATFTAEYSLSCCAIASDGVTIVAGEDSGRVHFLRLEGLTQP